MDDPVSRFLDRLERPEVDVPEEVDRRILAHARWVLLRRRLAPVAAVAAVLLVAVTIALDRSKGVPGDVNGDGAVDIIDAYVLAVRVREGAELESAWDFDGDGRIDERDVAVITERSVALR